MTFQQQQDSCLPNLLLLFLLSPTTHVR
jgi:hypothetical protein